MKLKKNKNRTNKINLVFDDEKRREFLTGFHKRKQQRKKKAQEKLEALLKEERKKLKSETKQYHKKLIASNRLIPELHEFTEEVEDDNVTVQVTELSGNNLIYENDQMDNDPICEVDKNLHESEEVPGMSLTLKCKREASPKIQFSSEKQVKKALRKTATKYVQNSTVFQKKNKMERQKQKKKSLQEKREKMKGKKLKEKHKNYKHKKSYKK
ncbi:hypothetical protein AMK59_8580 [Oryctes borbonicus]|uniref:Nucleolar protein 12 n=1 Tax=Oryctes borbonicus TaxID=1629725 RepID=A0A0T6AUK2_9SCAR|nr:hypothetical protein AMK59_8580 [Oryctes borbonicus]